MATKTVANPATPAQARFLDTLLDAVIKTFPQSQEAKNLDEISKIAVVAVWTRFREELAANPGFITKRRASSAIEDLKERRDRYQRDADKASRAVIEEKAGLIDGAQYAVGDEIYRVKRSLSSGVLLAYKLTIPGPEYGEKAKASWDYQGRADRFVSVADGAKLLERDEASAWGRRYGYCSACRAKLTKHESIDRGMGPICYGQDYTPGYVSPNK